MPEGPECKILVDSLNKKLKNKYITKIEIYSGRYHHHSKPKNFDKLNKLLPLKVKNINVYGKFIWYEFENTNLTLWNTLGLTGWYQSKEDKHNHIGFFYKKNKEEKVLYFNDIRNFGTFIIDTKENLDKKLKKFGPDILDKKDNTNVFIELARKSKKSICEILLDQKIATGSGNYLRADALYLSKINPFKKVKELSNDELKDLYDSLRQLAWYHYDEKKGKELKIINKKINFSLIKDRIFFVYSQKYDTQGKSILTKDVNGRTIHYSEIQIEE